MDRRVKNLLMEIRHWFVGLGYKAPETIEQDRQIFIKDINEILENEEDA